MKNFWIVIVGLLTTVEALAQQPIAMSTLLDSAKVRNAELRVMQSRYQQAQASPGPVGGIDATNISLTYGQIDGPVAEDYQVQVQQPLGNPVKGIYEKRKRESEVELASTELRLQEAYLEMALGKAYARWSSAYQQFNLREQQRNYYDSATASSQRLFETGEISAVEWGLSQSRMLAAKEMYFSAYSQYSEAQQQLEAICLMDLNEFLPADSLSGGLSLSVPAPSNGELQEQRLQAQEKVAERQLAITGAAMAPSFSVGYFNQQLNGISGYQGIMAGVDIPLLKIGNYKQRQIARLELEQAEINRSSQSYQLTRQIEMLRQQRQVIGEQLLDSDNLNASDLEQSMASALRLFKGGEIDFIQLSQMMDGLVDGYVRQQNLYYQLYSINAELKYLTR